MQERKGQNRKHGPALPGRRQVLGAGIALAATSLLPRNTAGASAQNTPSANTPPQSMPNDRRRLGTLEVSAVGLGVQNMSRTYQQTIPSRTEMFNIIRTAFDRGVTFYDATEAYGPHEMERSWAKAWFRSEIRSRSQPSSAGTSIRKLACGVRDSTAARNTSSGEMKP